MAEILYQLTHFTGAKHQARIEWLTENDCAKLNEHFVLAGQKQQTEDWLKDIYQKGIARYCLLYHEGIPAARGAVEPLSEQIWEASDIRTAKAFRNRGFAKEILRFLSCHILEHGKTAYCRTEEDNAAMRQVLQSVGYEEM